MGLFTPLAVRIGSIPWLPRYVPQITWVDKRLQRLTRGRLSLLGMAGLPSMMLTAIGRKSGVPRDTPLLCVPYGLDILIAGSNFGIDKEPMWVRNVEARPEVTARFRRRTSEMVARRLEGAERAAAWSHMVETWPNFVKYEERTDRQIKLFRLTVKP